MTTGNFREQIYSSFKIKHEQELAFQKRNYNLVAMARLIIAVLFIISIYLCFQNIYWILLSLVAFICYLALLKFHLKIAFKLKTAETLIEINDHEIDYLKNNILAFDNGKEFTDFTHQHSFDLDIFGEHSLFQHLNRTGTYIGKNALAELLQKKLPDDLIKLKQKAIRELAGNIQWRQDINAYAKLANDHKNFYFQLIKWSSNKIEAIPAYLNYISFLSPALLILSFTTFLFSSNVLFNYIAGLLFFFNIWILKTQSLKLKKELLSSGKINKIINQYSLVISKIENENFSAEYLVRLHERLNVHGIHVSKQFKKLSALFVSLEQMNNGLGSFILNGFFLYHIHIIKSLFHWKRNYSQYIPDWLDVIGEIESLNSLANLSFNNPGFAFPEINESFHIAFKNIGHPLIPDTKRITNDVSFNENRFIVLTGSNMSGKSTFLRTIGVNMVLAGTGAPVCASEAEIHPLPVIVSMRSTDSLSENESYFFAEVKRLKEIMNKLDEEICFVILDEILRGTNSDDKRSGTLSVLKKIINKKAIGAIATHDLEICQAINEYPGIIANNCFEAEIINNNLVFDYKLRPGICKNKSATFLMKKMGVID